MKKFEITQEQIANLYKSCWLSELKYDLKLMFPEAFEKPLEVGKWYKLPTTKFLICITDIKNNLAYGFDYDGIYHIENVFGFSDIIEATPQEVETALIAEAKKRYSNDVFIKSLYEICYKKPLGNTFDYFEDTNRLWNNGVKLFDNGQWAEIISTITKEEAEKLLNKKIV